MRLDQRDAVLEFAAELADGVEVIDDLANDFNGNVPTEIKSYLHALDHAGMVASRQGNSSAIPPIERWPISIIWQVANPAQLLLRQLREWQVTPKTAQNLPQPKAIERRNPLHDSFRMHRIAVQQLDAIDRLLDEMQAAGVNVRISRKYFPEWCKAVFCFPHGWDALPNRDIPEGIMEHLESLAESMRYYVPELQANGLDSIREYAQSVQDALQADTSIPEQLRIHAAEVIEHLLWCVESYDSVGDFLLSEALERLAATVVRVASHSSEENRETVWRSFFATNFVWPFTVSLMTAIPSQALALLALGH